jgi:hypothetical protein
MLKNQIDPKKIDVYSYRRAHRCASCTAGVICWGSGVATCNTQPFTKNILGTLKYLEFYTVVTS